MSDIKITISDLFFNSHEAEEINISYIENEEQTSPVYSMTKKQASAWLDKYPYFKAYFTPDELAKDYLKRV